MSKKVKTPDYRHSPSFRQQPVIPASRGLTKTPMSANETELRPQRYHGKKSSFFFLHFFFLHFFLFLFSFFLFFSSFFHFLMFESDRQTKRWTETDRQRTDRLLDWTDGPMDQRTDRDRPTDVFRTFSGLPGPILDAKV